MGNKQSAPAGKSETSFYVPSVNTFNSNNGENTPRTAQKRYDSIIRMKAIEVLELKNPNILKRGNKEEIEAAIQKILDNSKQEHENAQAEGENEVQKLLNRQKELNLAKNNATRANIQARHNAENRESRRAKMTPKELAENDELDKVMKKGGRRMRKKSRKNRTKRKVKII